ncbi:MAG: B12-binding domain-containing radical SAM protein [Desulfobacterales bacterium]|nr:B12-binding domain-containing radical SAM protein [Desulfobacterales bacterium]
MGERFKDVRLIDAPAKKWDREKVLNDAREFNPDLIVVDSNFSSLSNDIQVTRLLKENIKNSITVLVGPPVSQFPYMILDDGGVDIIAKFEYDFTIKELAEAIDQGNTFTNIKGISYKENGKKIHNPNREFSSSADLDKMPFVSKVYKEHLNIKDYSLSQSLYPEVQIFTGRGCPNRCTFCSWPVTLMGNKYRTRSVENIVDEFEYILEELPEVREIFIEDDTFTINKKLVSAFCEEIQRRKIDIAWSCNARADLDYNTMKAMKDAGCRLIIVGYESGSDEILKTIKKGVGTEQMKVFTNDAKKAGLLVHGDFIIGLPGETKDTAAQTLKFIKELKPNLLQVAVATPLPGTEFYDWIKKNGFMLVDNLEKSIDENGFQECIISYPDFTKEDIKISVDKALKEYYLSPSYIPVALSNVLRKNGMHELNSMLKSAKVFFKYMGRAK